MIHLQPSWAWTPEGVLQDPIVSIDDGFIVRCSAAERYPPVHLERLPGRLLMPGFVDAHSHAFQRAFRGWVQGRGQSHDDFWSWRRAMYGVANRLSPEGVYAVSRLAFLELVEAGVTEVGEFHYLHHQPSGQPYEDPEELSARVLEAASSVGIRITLLYVVYGRGGIGRELSPEQRRFASRDPEQALQAVERLRRRGPAQARIGLAPHSVRAIPPSWWPEFASFDGVVHVHTSEQPVEVQDCLSEVGMTPIELLAHHGLLGPSFTAVHLTHPRGRDLELMRGRSSNLAVCPSTELDLGDGFLPLEARRGIHLCVGSDSHARTDPFEEIRALELHARALGGVRNVMSPIDDGPESLAAALLRIGSAGGARALGAPAPAIAVGHAADLVAIDLRRPAALGSPPLTAAAFSATREWVDAVWVGGRQVVRDGRHEHRDAICAAAVGWLGVPDLRASSEP
ncbi:MAG: formimidoylglutamate deiminase [Deltaproteobacteria bacterium]|nr:MAG: formimidoylglutamate deiminase [Deltaproteobacteria bacterium]